jgi:hypothetical protein
MAELIPEVSAMINRFIAEIGLTEAETFNAERKAWYWKKGTANIEVFVQGVDVGSTKRYFLRVFSPVVKVPQSSAMPFYRRLLELNDTSLGVKLSVLSNSDQVYATYERDVKGMDYDEMANTIADVEWWADHFDDLLMREFGAAK